MNDFRIASNVAVRESHRVHQSHRCRVLRWRGAAAAAAVLLLSACALGHDDLVADPNKVAVSVSGVGHYGSKIGIPSFSVNGFSAGNATGWGGGGGGSCCVLLPSKVTKPVMVTVKWETYRSNVDEERHHEAKVPIHFAVQPGDSSGLYVHFLPGHLAEVWVTPGYPEGSQYPGPKYPRRPAPDYAPLPDEKPAQTGSDHK